MSQKKGNKNSFIMQHDQAPGVKAGILSPSYQWSIDDKPVKVDKWDGTAVKNALDDAVRKIFVEKYNFIEVHTLMDCRLAICGFAVFVAMFALIWDYLYPFPQSKPVLIICVLTYFVMMGILTLYTTLKEKGIFFEALEKDAAGMDPDKLWKASSYVKRFDDMYQLIITHSHNGKTNEAKLVKSVASWFDESGTLRFELFEVEVTKLHQSLTSDKKTK